MDYLLGIDLGSTSLKAMVYDLAGNVVTSGSRPTERFHPEPAHPEWTVWQPQQIWEGAAAAVRDAVGALDDPRHIRALAVVGMGMDGLPIDDRGCWLYPMISWLDSRTTPQFEWWKREIGAEKVFSIGGNPLWPINSALRILWMKENHPQILARADKWLLIEDFLNFMLCGRRVTDYSMASCTLLFDQRTLAWSDELLRLSGIDRRLLCEVQPSGTRIGEVTAAAAQATGLAAGTPVVLGGHDHLAGALPVGAFRPGVVLDVTGTWESVLTATPKPVLNPAFQKMGVTVQAHVARGRHSAWGGAVAAEMLEWYRKQYGAAVVQQAQQPHRAVWECLVDAAASAPPGAHGVMFLPHMSGAACPVVDSRSLGAFVGLGGQATSADMLRAVIEGLDYQLLDIVTAMQSELSTPLERFVAVGGATRNSFWMQNKADVLGRPLEVPAVTEATPLGAAILAGIGVGLYADEEEACGRVYKPGKTYYPDPALSARYARWFQIYRDLYPALAGVNHRLFDELRP
jgi:xylulokinase